MAEDLTARPHVGDLLGLYYSDALSDGLNATVRDHLLVCEPCAAAAQEAVEAVAALELLTPAERAELLASGDVSLP